MKKISIFLSFALLLCLLSSCSKTANNDKASGLNQIGNSSDTDNTHIYGENHTSEFYINNSTETQIYTKQKSTSFAISEEFTWDDYIVYAKKNRSGFNINGKLFQGILFRFREIYG